MTYPTRANAKYCTRVRAGPAVEGRPRARILVRNLGIQIEMKMAINRYGNYSYEYEFLRAGFLGSRIATCKKNAGKRGGVKRPPFVDEAFFLHVAIIDTK